MNDPTAGPMSLRQIHDAIAFKAVRGGFLDPLRVFFKEMELEWADVNTACAFRRKGVPVIQLGRRFFQEKVQGDGEAADVVYHEIFHHLLRHLIIMKELERRGYSHPVQNVAMDAVINSHLHSVGCAEFMERFYPDRGELAFLRPNSSLFATLGGIWGFRKVQPVHMLRPRKAQEFHAFYRKLYALQATLEDSLEFFQKHFPKPKGEQELLGSHGEDANAAKDADKDQPGGGGLFDEAAARKILEALKIVPAAVSRNTVNNFAEVIARVALLLLKDGATKAERRVSRRVPAKLNRQDVINIERDRYLFQRSDYRLKEVVLMPDISGSMDKYLAFIIGLISRLRRADLTVRVVCWANRPVEVPFEEIMKGNLPKKVDRGSTDGEALARFISSERIGQAVIITDNAAGRITTPINARVQLCLVEGSSESGSFLDKNVVPRCQVHRLKLS